MMNSFPKQTEVSVISKVQQRPMGMRMKEGATLSGRESGKGDGRKEGMGRERKKI